jgi:toxin ParE1/3/4
MKLRLSLKAEAVQDMTEAFEWYEKEKAGLGVEFLDQIEDYCQRITEHPEQFQSYRN